jgi:hypothetical protein
MNKDRAIVLIGPATVVRLAGIHEAVRTSINRRFARTDYARLKCPFGLGDVLKNEPDAVIVEECPVSVLEDPWVKALLSVKEIRTGRRGEEPREVIQPRWIFIIELPEEYAQQFKIIPLG